MPQFFINENDIDGEKAVIRGDDFYHLTRVRRAKSGDILDIRITNGKSCKAVITEIGEGALEVRLREESDPETETVNITLYIALIKGGNFELALQKAVEAGVNSIVPVTTSRTVPHLPKKIDDRIARWSKIVTGAAKQCMRGFVPSVKSPVSFSEAVEDDSSAVKLIAHTDKAVNIREYLSSLERPESVSILVGPEGGFSSGEIASAGVNGWVPVRFGTTCLRAETAAMIIPALVIYQWS